MSKPVRLALIAGPMYEGLYHVLDKFIAVRHVGVEIGYQSDHPSLNAHLASARDLHYDLVSTHTKYAPSQTHFLAPLQTLIEPGELADFYPNIIDLATVEGNLLGLPRNIDVRLLHYRTDLIDALPQTWDELFKLAHHLTKAPDFYGFAFPGRESGLFGTFFELTEAGGAHLFPDNLVPDILNDGGRWALRSLHNVYTGGAVPPQLVDWHYDEIHSVFRTGHVAMVGDWPASYASHLDPVRSPVHDRFSVAAYPAGPSGSSKTYGGCHTFALTHRGADNPDAIDLLRFLTAPERQLEEAQRGSVPVRFSVMQHVKEMASERELIRWDILESVIKNHVLIPPKIHRYPEIEEVLWRTVQMAMIGKISEDEALESMISKITQIVGPR